MDPALQPANDLRRQRAVWCLFDFANSPFPTVALTAFGAPYFEAILIGNEGVSLLGLELGSKTAWGVSLALSMFLVMVTAPFLGVVADRSGTRRPFLIAYVLLCVAATAGLAFVPPGHGLLAMGLYIVANFAFEGAYVFYNAFLPDLAPPDRVGRLSGYGWAFGYVGGLLALLVVRDVVPLLPDEYATAGDSNASFIYLVIAVWYLVFSLPALVWLKGGRARASADSPPTDAPRYSIRSIVTTLRAFPVMATFLFAYFLYNDGLTTVIEFVGIFTKDALAFTPRDNVLLFLILNVVAAPGAVAFGFALDRLGGKRAIIITLVCWMLVVVGAVLATSKMSFWPVAILAAVVIGATQASSRSLMAKFAPAHRTAEFMGLLAVGGRASAIMGPVAYGLVADGFAEQLGVAGANRLAVGLIGILFLVALVVMLRVDEPLGVKQAKEAR